VHLSGHCLLLTQLTQTVAAAGYTVPLIGVRYTVSATASAVAASAVAGTPGTGAVLTIMMYNSILLRLIEHYKFNDT